jgi:hypothetical protein
MESVSELRNYIFPECIIILISSLTSFLFAVGHAIAQVVCRRLPTAAAQVRGQVRSCEICGGQSGTGACFHRVLRFPLPILIPPTAPHISSRAGTMGQLVADVPSGRSLYLLLFLILYKHRNTGIFPSGRWVDELFHGSSYVSFTAIRSSVYPMIE